MSLLHSAKLVDKWFSTNLAAVDVLMHRHTALLSCLIVAETTAVRLIAAREPLCRKRPASHRCGRAPASSQRSCEQLASRSTDGSDPSHPYPCCLISSHCLVSGPPPLCTLQPAHQRPSPLPPLSYSDASASLRVLTVAMLHWASRQCLANDPTPISARPCRQTQAGRRGHLPRM